jgi:hypothetical protein
VFLVAQKVIWPNFFVVGAQKCGTTSIYEHLKKHPQVFIPEAKEPGYFITCPNQEENQNMAQLLHCNSLEEYQKLFQDSEGYQAIGDFSTGYLWDRDAPHRIKEACPQAKIILILRDPVVRAYSAYIWNLKTRCPETAPSFQEALQRDAMRSKENWCSSYLYVECGLYFEQVQRYIKTFGADQVLVLMFDDLAKDPQKLFSKIAVHLGINPAFLSSTELSKAYNSYRNPRFQWAYRYARTTFSKELRRKILPDFVQNWLRFSPLLYRTKRSAIDEKSKQLLQKVYDPDITQLEELLGRKLPELRKSWS